MSIASFSVKPHLPPVKVSLPERPQDRPDSTPQGGSSPRACLMSEVLQEPRRFPPFHILSPSHLFPTQLPGHALQGPKRSGGFCSPSEGRGRPCRTHQAVHSLGWHPLLFAPSHPCASSHRPPGWLSRPASNAPTWALAYPFCCGKNPQRALPSFFRFLSSLRVPPGPPSPPTVTFYILILLFVSSWPLTTVT